MDELSIFQEKDTKPTSDLLAEKLGSTYKIWIQIENYVMDKYPAGLQEWYYSGKKFGWNYRIKDKKRAIIYFLPRDNYFKVAFSFGEKATAAVLNSDISSDIKTELEQARKYAEGRGIRIEIKDELILPDIKQLIDIKLKN